MYFICQQPIFTCGNPFTDSRDGKTYNTVQIGDQCWMANNLNIGARINGSSDQTNNSIIEKHCYNDLESNCDVYGGLYHWNEMMQYVTTEGAKGICPTGWHVPSDAEWCQMEIYLDPTVNCLAQGYRGTDAGGKMKETGTTHWSSPNLGATNTSGFTAFPGGWRDINASFIILSYEASLWSSSQVDASIAWRRALFYDYEGIYRYTYYKDAGFSVRCLKDN
jgi:uncharacterized protein (TIGR02145 family)